MKLLTVLFVLFLQAALADDAFSFREYTSSDGRPLQAKLLMLEGSSVKIETKSGKTFELGLGKFSEADQQFIKDAYKEGGDSVSSAPAADVDAPQGKVTEPINANDESSYHLYVPNSLVGGRKAPLYMLTLAGGGKNTKSINALTEISELLGAVVALSVESSNSNGNTSSKKSIPNFEHTQNCVEHILETLPVDEERIIFGGSSGGAANAFNTASFIPALAVINRIGYKSDSYKPKMEYCYGICGGSDYNRYYVAASARDMRDNGFHRIIPGGHTGGKVEDEVAALFWVHCKHLGDNQSEFREESSSFIDKALTWLEGEKPEGIVYHNALLLGDNLDLSTQQKGRHNTLLNSLKSDPQNVLFHEGLIALNEFSRKEIKTSEKGSQLNMEDPQLAAKAKELEPKLGSIQEFKDAIRSLQEKTAGTKKKK